MGAVGRQFSISVFIWITGTACLVCSASANPSFWGKKAAFIKSCYWQLAVGCVVPALQELSVCVDLQRWENRSDWTAFVYKRPGGDSVELGLVGTNRQLQALLFGQKWHVKVDLPLYSWHTTCLTWSGRSRQLQLYINRTTHLDVRVNASLPSRLGANGTLTLGRSHNVLNGKMELEWGKDFTGNMSLFRMWGRELTPEQVQEMECVDGDVVRWSSRDLDNNTCTAPEPDDSFKCDAFYRVKLNVSVNGTTADPGHTIESWLQHVLGFEVLNFMLMTEACNWVHQSVGRTPGVDVVPMQKQRRYEYIFQVHAVAPLNVVETGTHIFNCTSQKHISGSITTQDPHISLIEPGYCPEEFMQTLYGAFYWDPTQAGRERNILCEKGGKADRLCKVDGITNKAMWDAPNTSSCKKVVNDIDDLDNVIVTPDNAVDIVDMIENLLVNQTNLTQPQLNVVLDKLSDVIKVSPMTPTLGKDIVNVMSEILDSEDTLTEVTKKILMIIDSVGDKMNFTGGSLNMTAPSLALQLIDVNASLFHGLTFGVSSFSNGLPELFVNQSFVNQPFIGTEATISLPSALEDFFPQDDRTRPRVQFHFYSTDNLFKDHESNMKLNTYVVSTSVTNTSVSALQQPVVITLRHHKPKEEQHRVQCVYWDFQRNNGSGGWDSTGCETHPEHSDANQTTCHCFHLTHFGVLLDVTRTRLSEEDEHILTIISYVGCGASSVFLGITLLTYVAFEKLRRDHPSKILINLSVALLGLNMVFLVNSWLASFDSYALCIAVAATMHYLILASFTWMCLEAVHMYFALVKVFNIYIPSYILKFCALGWGVPLVIVSLVLAIQMDAYGNTLYEDALRPLDDTSPFCWIQNDEAFYITVVAFVALVLLCNVTVFGVVLVQICRMRANKPLDNSGGLLHDLRVVASLTILLGLTWTLAFFAWGVARVPLLYLFSVFNSLQGLLVFLFHCLMKENVRKQWRIHLCCGLLRLSDYSDCSLSVTLGGKVKPRSLVSLPCETENTSDIRKSSNPSDSGARTRGLT